MATFNYIAKNKEGQDIRSTIDAASRLEALELLRKKGLTVVDLVGAETGKPRTIVAKSEEKKKDRTKKPKSSLFAAKVKMGELAIFCRQLAISVTAGVPLRDALETIGEDLEQPMLRHAVMDIVGQLNDGKNFSEAAASHPKVFNIMFCGLIRVAEESGKLPQTLKQLADYLERTDKLQRRIKAMSAYPMFIGVFFIARDTPAGNHAAQVKAFANFLAYIVEAPGEAQAAVFRVDEDVDAVKHIAVGVVSGEGFVTGDLIVSMVVAELAIVHQQRQGAADNLAIDLDGKLTLGKLAQ